MEESFEAVIRDVASEIFCTFVHRQVRPITISLIFCLILDLPLTPAIIVDFGVATPDHYRALQAVVKTPEKVDLADLGKELDSALGKGAALGALVKKYASEYGEVTFHTDWDELRAIGSGVDQASE